MKHDQNTWHFGPTYRRYDRQFRHMMTVAKRFQVTPFENLRAYEHKFGTLIQLAN